MFRKIIIGIALNGLALFFVTHLLESVTYKGGFWFFTIAGVIIGVLNTIVKPLIKLISLPLVFLTAGLFLFALNTIILWLTKEIIDIIHIRDVMFEISGFTNYLIAGFLFGVINWVEHLIVHNK